MEEYSRWSYADVFVISCFGCEIKVFACECHMIFLMLGSTFKFSEPKWMVIADTKY